MNEEPDHEVLDPDCKNKVIIPFGHISKIAQLEDDLAKCEEINRTNYDAANAYMEISTKVRGENDSLKTRCEDLLKEAEELRREIYQAEAAIDVKNKALTRLSCIAHTMRSNEFTDVIRMELDDCEKQVIEALSNPLKQ